jgi:membrane-associated phospholipid phosphatase
MDRRVLTWREINRRVTRPFTIRVNTFPSGHASATLAVAIAVIAAAPVPGLILLLLALSVAVASVVGRYHYGADVLAGLALAVLASALGTSLAG